jgi:hypothetical protein
MPRSPLHVALERLAFEKLHRVVRAPVVRHAEVVQLNEVRMTQARARPGLLTEAQLVLGREGSALREHLERDYAPGIDVGRFVDDAHRAAPDFAEDAVAGAGEERFVSRPGAGLGRGPVSGFGSALRDSAMSLPSSARDLAGSAG